MSITCSLHHVTHYHYDRLTTLGMQTVRLRPAPHARSPIQSYSLKVFPADHFINWQQDPFGNFMARVVFPKPVKEFKIEVDLVTEIRVYNPFDFFLEEYAQSFPFDYEASLKQELAPYLEKKEAGEGLLNWVEQTKVDTDENGKKEQGLIDYLVAVNQKLNQQLKYLVRMEPGVQSCEETLELGSGSCRDMAWFLCQALRHHGLATRFASGYLIQLAADVKSLDGPSGTEVDFTDLHAWTEVYLPGAGWVGLDPTSGLIAGEGHIPLCCTPNPSSAAPVTGTLESNVKSTLKHDMAVQRLVEMPRVTKPYSEAQWSAIDALGEKVEAELDAQDIRLTMGGEPTFVSLDDREHRTWHFDALGGEKKALGKDLLKRLSMRFAPGGLTMHVQGKWYPGEILPRWALPCYWRVDGDALWQEPALLADPEKSLDHKVEQGQQFLAGIARHLGIPEDYLIPAREDTPYYLWQEGRLPLQDEMLSSNVYDKAERKRLQRLMDSDLNSPTGYVLPLHYSHRRQRWISNRWEFTSEHMVLLIGDSPIGLRLPLSSLPYPSNSEDEVCPERSSFETTERLPSRAAILDSVLSRADVDDKPFKEDANGLIRTAICAEVRNGVLHLFLPPTAWLEHFVELIAAIELVAQKLGTPVVIEGYGPPSDKRLANFSVTPDPGVIEVNVQPAKNWEELKAITQTIYEEARLARLSTEKFLIDGRRVGTGGGNHLVLGAAEPADSPFLRKPQLLRSLVTFWQNHPALSYLFAGQFIGPTSQSPRIDEARHDALYELEIAFQQIPDDETVPPWLVDRLFRNLLVDLTGNTHRAEFCIDKLYSPDSERGRLGLLEMRGFEMTPHYQMNLLQALLMRACVAHFWRRPYQSNLIRWGTRLHDRYMLPHFLEADFYDALAELEAGGFAFSKDWFVPFFAFRFPECGRMQVGDITLILHTALEPWSVMGEESSGGGTSRSVDATVERVQVTVTGLIEGRHILTCNGRRVPLVPTAVAGTQVAGVRFKAWSQPSSLHPNLPVNAPLVFDIIDAAGQRSLGGCTYRVAHPGGRNHETFPVNENEAEGRRLSRFEAMGHTPGKVEIPPLETNLEFPCTLDLRNAAQH